MISEALDSLIGVFSPSWAAARTEARRALLRARNVYGRERRGRQNDLPPAQPWSDPDWHLRQAGRVAERQRDRSDSIQLAQVNPVAKALARTVTDFVVPDAYEFRSLSRDTEAAKRYTDGFGEWLAGKCDVKGRTFGQSLRRFVWWGFVTGDAGWAMLDRGPDAGRLQLLTGDRIWHPARSDSRDPGLAIIDGVAADDLGRPVAYYVRDKDLKTVRIPAAGFAGLHFDEFHHDDVRGQPGFATTYDKIQQYDDLVDAVVTAMRRAAKVALVIKRAQPGPAQGGGPEDRPRTNLANGMILDNLRTGDEISQLQAAQPHQAMEPFALHLLRVIGMPDGVPVELLNLNFAQGSFSAINASFAVWRHKVRTWQGDLAVGPPADVWRWWVDREIVAGRLPFAADRYAHKWTAKPAEYLFPQEQAQADAILRDLGVKSWADLMDERGIDPERQLAEIAVWEERLRKAKAGICRSTATRPDLTTLPAASPAPTAADKPAPPETPAP